MKIETYICDSDAEARGLRDGTITLLVIPIPKQPESLGFGRNCEVHPYCTGTKWPLAYYERKAGTWNSSPPLPCPFAPGDEIGVKEAWGHCVCKRPGHSGFLYPDNPSWNTLASGTHFGAANMPRKAIRTRLLCQSVEARQVRSITINQAVAAGTRDLRTIENTIIKNYVECFAEKWNKRHPDLPFEQAWAWFCTVKLERKP